MPVEYQNLNPSDPLTGGEVLLGATSAAGTPRLLLLSAIVQHVDESHDLLLQHTAQTGNFALTLTMSGKVVPFTPGGTITLPASFDGFHCVLDSTGTGTATFSGATILGDASVGCVNGTQIAIRRRGTSAGAQWIIKGIQP